MDSWVWLVAGWGGMVGTRPAWVVDAFSRVPGAVFSFRFDFPAMLVAYGMLLSILLYGHTGRSRYLLVILFLLLIILLVRVIEDLKQCGI